MENDHKHVGSDPWHFPLLIAGGALLVWIALRQSSGGQATVIGQTSANDIIASNTAAGQTQAALNAKVADDLTSYFVTKSNNDTALASAVANGATTMQVQALVSKGQADLATVEANKELGIANINGQYAVQGASLASKTTIAQAQIAAQEGEVATQAQEASSIAASNAQVDAVKASKPSWWQSLLGAAPGIISAGGGAGLFGALHGSRTTPQAQPTSPTPTLGFQIPNISVPQAPTNLYGFSSSAPSNPFSGWSFRPGGGSYR